MNLQVNIYESFARNKPRNYAQVQDLIYDEIGKSVKLITIYHIISKNSKIKVVAGIPMEKVRAESTLEFIIDCSHLSKVLFILFQCLGKLILNFQRSKQKKKRQTNKFLSWLTVYRGRYLFFHF